MPVLSFPYLHFLSGQRHIFPTVLPGLLLCLPLLLPLKTQAQAQAQAQQNTEQGAVLKRVILVTRHGIRSPTQTPESLEAKTGVIWSAWPVPPGELTEHGRTDVARLGAFLHRYYQAFLPQNGRPCATPSSLFVWADAADNRTRETGNVLSKTLSAGCLKTAASLPAGQKDPLFNALASGHETLDKHSVLSTLTQTLPHGEAAPEDVRQATSSLQTLFAPQGCIQSKGVCFSAPAKLSWKKGAPHVTGGLALASTVSENLLLEYCEGLASTVQASALTGEHISSASPTLDDHAFPNQAALLATVVPAHTYLSHLTRCLPAIAIPRGRYMADAIGSLLTDPITRLPDGSTIPASSRMVVFVGHDTTLDMLATLFGLDWTFTDQPDPTAPDTTLGFELWQDGTGAPFVRFVVFHQSLEQLRNASPVEDRTDSGNPVILRSSLCPKGKKEEKCRPLLLAHSLRSEEGRMLQKSP
ncbi:histidine-type phosphatase [Acetobacter senegalensis]|uniref:histidine-type phosphatase n=1 Tax=Acetobacter senegalensis TaxID=446692 RepID=UPI001EDC5FBC|nr:histidine-type phosphatase [Acetobacter senegalensis]MCG4257358.1 histidine-type phosphatase [Acetobacter senegalensis]MCG4267440.1 histidine-type phosphatase [Acetobacter senegalensis]